jgi:hypothetical protein
MIASPLLFMAEYLGRFDPRRRQRTKGTVLTVRDGLAAVGRVFKQNPPPPYLSDHLCRDIGLEPTPKRQDWFWPW